MQSEQQAPGSCSAWALTNPSELALGDSLLLVLRLLWPCVLCCADALHIHLAGRTPGVGPKGVLSILMVALLCPPERLLHTSGPRGVREGLCPAGSLVALRLSCPLHHLLQPGRLSWLWTLPTGEPENTLSACPPHPLPLLHVSFWNSNIA